MFKSIKTKMIVTVMVLFLLGVGAMTFISGMHVKNKTEESVIEQSTVLIDEMSNSTTNFLEQFDKGIHQLANTTIMQDFQREGGDVDKKEAAQLLITLENELTSFIDLFKESSSVYYSLLDGYLTIRPYVDLGKDFDARERDWFKDAIESSDLVQWTPPYIDSATDEFVVSASKAVRKSTNSIGVVGLDIQLSALTDTFADKELGYEGYPVMLDQEGVAIVHPSMRGENLIDLPFIKEMYGEGNEDGVVYYTHEGIDRVIVFTTIPDFNWKIGAVYDIANINATASETQRAMMIIALITLAVFCIVLYILM